MMDNRAVKKVINRGPGGRRRAQKRWVEDVEEDLLYLGVRQWRILVQNSDM